MISTAACLDIVQFRLACSPIFYTHTKESDEFWSPPLNLAFCGY